MGWEYGAVLFVSQARILYQEWEAKSGENH